MAGTLKVDTISNLAATGYIGTEGASLDLSKVNSLVLPTGGTGTDPLLLKQEQCVIIVIRMMEYYNGTEWLNTDGSKNDTNNIDIWFGLDRNSKHWRLKEYKVLYKEL